MTFDWSINLGHLLTLAGVLLSMVGTMIRLERRITRYETVMEPVLRLVAGNGRPPLDTRVALVERELADGRDYEVETRNRLSDTQHALNNLTQVCVLRHPQKPPR